LSVTVQSLSGTSVKVSCLGEYAYVANAADNTLSSYRIDVTTGALAAIDPPIATGVSPRAVVSYELFDSATPKAYVYVSNEGSNDISAFAVDIATGAELGPT
jgi:6-phosphogluconolactonase (cycloisomerase 2 family)